MSKKKEYNSKYFIVFSIITILLMLKIYIANEIYYTSRDIQKLSMKINALKEERNILKLKIEKLKYKNTIADPLSTYFESNNTIENEQPTQDTEKEDQDTQQTASAQTEETKKKQKNRTKSTKDLFEKIDKEGLF